MMKLLFTIRCTGWLIMLMHLWALTDVMAQPVVNSGDTTKLSVGQEINTSYKWELYSDQSINFATTPGNCPITSAVFQSANNESSATIKWLKSGTYFFKVTASDASGCPSNLKIGIITVKESLPTGIILQPALICTGETVMLNFILTGTKPWILTFSDGFESWTISTINSTPYTHNVSPKMTTSYWITSVSDRNGTNNTKSNAILLQVNQKPSGSLIYLYIP